MKPSTPKGTRDFGPEEVAKRNYIISTIREIFSLYGFQPIETPSFENSETLMGKYGDEGDRLIFKILNSGDYLSKVPDEDYILKDSHRLTPLISEKALRYDLTVPFARYVVQHQNELNFPFKRYQIQPVWRADRPQKGRFREFYQCDADVIGSDSLWQDVEFVQLYDRVFHKLGLHGVRININNRKILGGIAEVIGAEEKLVDFTVALDKLDKIGAEGVRKEMISKGIPEKSLEQIDPLLSLKGSSSEKLEVLRKLLSNSTIGLKGVSELEFVVARTEALGLQSSALDLNVTLARGLNYYTGTILEISAPPEVSMGSIGGGGRYDDLTGIFGLKNMSGIGISFGLDRIYLVLEELNLFPETINKGTTALFLNFGDHETAYVMKAMKHLRNSGISVELYPEKAKMGKQMSYADKRGIPFTILAGNKEMEQKVFTIKDMETGEQEEVTLEKLLIKLQNS